MIFSKLFPIYYLIVKRSLCPLNKGGDHCTGFLSYMVDSAVFSAPSIGPELALAVTGIQAVNQQVRAGYLCVCDFNIFKRYIQ